MGLFHKGGTKAQKQGFWRASNGNIAIAVAVCALPMILACGVALDYARMVTLKTQFDAIAENAALQAVDKAAMPLSDEQAQAEAYSKFQSMAKASGVGTLVHTLIKVTTTPNNIRNAGVYYIASVPASFTSLMGLQNLTVSNLVAARSSMPTNLDIYVLVDNTPSMGFPATTDGIATMETVTKNYVHSSSITGFEGQCAQACHIAGADYDYYWIARRIPVALRLDTAINAVNSLLAYAQLRAGDFGSLRFALYSFGSNTESETLTNISPLSSDISAAQSAVGSIDLMTTNLSDPRNTTYFPFVMNWVNSTIPDSGDGTSQASSKKVFFFISDGVEDGQDFPCSQWNPITGIWCRSPIDPALCQQLKDRGITVAVIYTTYLPINDYWYNTTIAPFNAGPFSPSPNSQIAQNMKACASPGFYQEAGPNDSTAGLIINMFTQFASGLYPQVTR